MHYSNDELLRRPLHVETKHNDTTSCIYCGGVVEATYDPECNSYSLSQKHFECWHSGNYSGKGYVVASNCPSTSGMSFPYLLRAMHAADDIAGWNRGLEVVVFKPETGVVLYSTRKG